MGQERLGRPTGRVAVRRGRVSPVAASARLSSAVSTASLACSALLVGLLMVLGLWSVAARGTALPYPPGTNDLLGLVLAAVAVLAWPSGHTSGINVATHVVVDRVPVLAAAACRLAAELASAAVVAWFALSSWQRAQTSLAAGETTIGADRLPVWPLRMLLTLMLLVLLAQMALTCVEAFRRLSTKSQGVASGTPYAIGEDA